MQETQEYPEVELSEFKTFQGRAENFYYIRTKDNQLVPFEFLEPQKILDNIVEEEFKRNMKQFGVKRCNLMILKGRQTGTSTYTELRGIDMQSTLDMCSGLVVAHNNETTDVLYDIFKRAHENMPEYFVPKKENEIVRDEEGKPVHIEVKPETRAFSGKRLEYERNDSRLLVQTAGAGDNVGRGITLNFFHGCLHQDSLVILSDGTSKKIKDIQAGDKVITHNGHVASVKRNIYTGKKQTYEINVWLSNQTISATEDHKILTDSGWKQVKDITKKDYIQHPNIELTNEIKEYSFELKTKERPQGGGSQLKHESVTLPLNNTFGYVLGYYLAEGHVKKGNWQVDFASHEDETYFEKIRDFCEQYSTSVTEKNYEDSKRKRYICRGKFFASLIEDICGRTKDKYIPDWFFKTNKEFIEGVIAGYFSGDGSKKMESVKTSHKGKKYNHKINRVKATSINESISRQIRRLIIALGVGVPSISYRDKVYRYEKQVNSTYTLKCNGVVGEYIRTLIDNNCEANPTAQRKAKCIDGTWFVKVNEIKEHEKTDVYDLEIDHEDHSYQTPVGIVSNSECAFWPEFEDTLTSLKQALPRNGEVFCVLESTANGVSGRGEGFYKLWLKSQKEWDNYIAGKTQTFSGFRPVFIPWYMMNEYRLPLAGGKMESIDEIDFGSADGKQEYIEKEKRLLSGVRNPMNGEKVKLSKEQLNWYRWCIKENCNYKYSIAKKEYPTFPDEAFTASNNCFFDTEKLTEVKSYYSFEKENEYKQGEIVWNDESDVVFQTDAAGYLKIWYEPEDGWENRYVIGADPAYGYEDGDYGVLKVFDRLKQRFCARWYGRVDEDILAEELTKLGIYYNEALLVPERNLATVVNIVKPDGIHPYVGEVYWEESGRDLKYGKFIGNDRKVLLDMYLAWVREDYYKLPDLAEVDEHLSFVKKERKRGSKDNVKYEADEGAHDDIVMANMLAIYGDQWWDRSPKERKFQKLTDIIRKPKRRARKRWKQSSLGKSFNVN